MREPSLAAQPRWATPVFDTAVGRCAGMGAAGLRAVQLPEQDDAGHGGAVAARQRPFVMQRPRHPMLPLPSGMAALQGHKLDLREVVLDMTQVSDFHQRVYAITRAIPPGQVRTYGDIAEQLGSKGLARAVGQALA